MIKKFFNFKNKILNVIFISIFIVLASIVIALSYTGFRYLILRGMGTISFNNENNKEINKYIDEYIKNENDKNNEKFLNVNPGEKFK